MISDYFLIMMCIIILSIVLDKYWKTNVFRGYQWVAGSVIPLIVATAWDQYANWRGHWLMNPQYLIGINIGYMPLENYLYALALLFLPVVIWNYFVHKTKR